MVTVIILHGENGVELIKAETIAEVKPAVMKVMDIIQENKDA